MKQVIVVRKDLKMSKGKCCAQVGHACVKSVMEYSFEMKTCKWYKDGMSKIVVSCNSEDELLQLAGQASTLGLATALIKDAGYTQVEEGTYTCCAIGPDEDDKIDDLTGHLKLL